MKILTDKSVFLKNRYPVAVGDDPAGRQGKGAWPMASPFPLSCNGFMRCCPGPDCLSCRKLLHVSECRCHRFRNRKCLLTIYEKSRKCRHPVFPAFLNLPLLSSQASIPVERHTVGLHPDLLPYFSDSFLVLLAAFFRLACNQVKMCCRVSEHCVDEAHDELHVFLDEAS